MTDAIFNADVSVCEFFAHSDIAPFWDKVMIFITSLGDLGLIWILIGVALVLGKKTRMFGIAFSVSLLVTFLLSEEVMKPLVDRARPYMTVENIELLIAAPGGPSFPSSHAATSFACAISLFCYDKRFGSAALVLASLIAFSRIYLCVHFLSDVIAGSIVGLTLGFFITYFIFIKNFTKVDNK